MGGYPFLRGLAALRQMAGMGTWGKEEPSDAREGQGQPHAPRAATVGLQGGAIHVPSLPPAWLWHTTAPACGTDVASGQQTAGAQFQGGERLPPGSHPPNSQTP